MICWTQREWQLIAERLVHTHVDPSLHGWRSELVAAMRMVLPNDRWRDPTCLSNAKQILVPMMKSVGINPPEKKESPPTPTAAQLSTEDLLVELARRVAKLLTLSTTEQDVLKQLRFLEEKFKDPVDRGFYPPPEHELAGKPVARSPRILIVGPRNRQQEELRNGHPKLRLHFVASEERPALIDSVAACCDEIIIWTNFVSHQHTEHAKATGRPMTLITGGLSAVRHRLANWEMLT